ncbi:tail fiber domain-containing protein [Burkholderia latens]|uniref:tail fiber domain-containing protein n=1 Tax=Burkholderia latens TaxID=488446 RepID=UPI001AE542AA|nr:tail fiber domain-containing protein [Burkholderia latens]QTO46307.1 tail fiber domain-containing protein [Burkholderia latens]
MSASLLPNAKTQFLDGNGKPLAGGQVFFYIPNTSTKKDTYQDPAQTILNTNPVILDASGEALIWGSGTYRQVVYDQFGNLIWDQITQDANASLTGNLVDKVYVAGTDFTPGVTTQLTLPAAPGSVTNMWVFFDAAYQDDTQIQSIVGTTLTFNSAIPVGITKVTVKIGTTVAIGIPGNGTITDSMVAAGSKLSNRLKYIVYAQDFGAVGNWNGVTGTNDTAAIQSALNSFTIAGGTLHLGSLSYLVDSLTIPQNVSIVGDLENPEQTIASAAQNYYSWGSQLCLTAGSTITMSQGTALRGVLVIRQGLSLPVTTDAQATTVISQFSGTGLTVSGTGVKLEDVMLLGHTQAITVTTNSGNQGRFYMTNVHIDSTNGVSISGAYDICRLFAVHCWPFLTVQVSGISNANLARSGIAFSFDTVDDWTQLISCFGYGYSTTYKCMSTGNIGFIGCQSDTSGSAYTAYGWDLEGSSAYTHLEGCMQNGAATCLRINSTGTTWPEVRTVNCNWNAGTICIDVTAGRLQSCNDVFHSGTSGIGFGAGTIVGSSLINPYFINVGTPWNFANSTVSQTVSIITPSFGNNTSPNSSNILSNLTLISQQAAVAGNGPALLLNGNYGTYTGLMGQWQARLVSGTVGAEANDMVYTTYRSGTVVDRLKIDHDGHLYPAQDNAYTCGGASNRWSIVYAANGTIQTSDENEKENFQAIDDVLLDAFASLAPVQFRWKDSDDRRWRIGYKAQDLQRALIERGANPEDYSVWSNEEIFEDGKPTGKFRQGLDYNQIAVLRDALSRRNDSNGVH